MFYLVVISPFGSYAVGTIITDPAVIATIEAGPYRNYVTKIAGGGGGTTESLTIGVTRAQVGTPLLLGGQVANATPSALDWSTDNGATWTAVGNYVLSGSNWTGTGPTYTSTQSGVILVRDHANQGITGGPANFTVVLPGGTGSGTLALSDGSAMSGIGAGLSAGTLGAPAALVVQFGTVTGTVADGGALSAGLATNASAAAAAQATASAALPAAGGTMTGNLAFSSTSATISATGTFVLQPVNQLWLGAQAGSGAVYSSTIGTTTSLPSTVSNKLWNNGGVVSISNSTTLAPNPTFAPGFMSVQPWADTAGNTAIFSHNGGVVPTPPTPLTGLRFADRVKISGVYNFGEVWQPSAFYDCWPSLQNFLLYAQLMFLAQSGTSLANIAERQFVDVILPAGKYYLSQPLIVPEYVRFGGPGVLLPTPYVGAQTGGSLVSGAFDSTSGAPYAATAQYTPLVVVCPRAHLSDLNICVSYDGSFAHKSSGVVFGKNWQPAAGSSVTIGSAGSGYSVGDTLKLAQPSSAPFSACVVTITAVNGTGGVTAATVGPFQGDFALPPATYGSGPNLQTQQWTAANGFAVFDASHAGCFLTTNFTGTKAGSGATIGLPTWVADFVTGANQYTTGAGLTNGSQAGRIQITGGVNNNYSADYGPTFNVMVSGLENEIDSIQGLGGKVGLWVRYGQDTRINRLNFVDSSIFAWFSGAGSIECANCVADTCGAVLQIDQSHGIRMHGRAFFEEGNITNPLPACNSNGAAFMIGATSSAQYPVVACDIKFTVINMGGLPASTISAKSLTGVSPTQQAACASLAYMVSSVFDLTVSNYSQYGASGGTPYPNPSLLPTSGIYAIGYDVDPGNVLRGSLDTVPTIDGVTPTGTLAAIVTSTTSQGIRQNIDVWDGLHNARIGPCGIADIYGSGAPSNGTSGTGANYAPPTSTYRDQASGITYRNTGTKASPTWTTP